MLIEGDFSKATDNLQYMRKFILKLKTMTDANDIEWDTITVADVDDALHSTSEEEELPIIGKYTGKPVTDEKPKSAEYRDYSLPEYGTKKVKSAAIGERVWVNGNGYKAGLGNGTTMYLFKMSGDFPIDAEGNTEIIDYYDIYFMEWVLRDGCDDSYGQPDDKDYERHFSPVCNTWNNARDISKDIAALYKSISRHEWDLKISPHVRSSIESFMNPVSLDDEMPFI